MVCCIPNKMCCDPSLWGHFIVNFKGGWWSPCEMCCSLPVRPAVHFVRYVMAILLEQVIIWIVLALHPTPVSWVVISSKVRDLERKERSGIDTIKYHTWPTTPYWKVTKAQWNITYKRAKRPPFPSRWPQCCKKQTSQKEKTNTKINPQKKHRLGKVREWNYWRA